MTTIHQVGFGDGTAWSTPEVAILTYGDGLWVVGRIRKARSSISRIEQTEDHGAERSGVRPAVVIDRYRCRLSAETYQACQ